MRIKVVFGLAGPKKMIDWYNDVKSFPKILKHKGKNWEWVMYDKEKDGSYTLTFSEINSWDPNYNVWAEDFETAFRLNLDERCECGAIYTSFPQLHLTYCKMWKAWDQI